MEPSLFSQQARPARPSRSAADLQRAGVTRSQTSGRRWQRTLHGYYAPTERATSTAERIFDSSVCVPQGGALAGWAAAYIFGVDWLDGIGLDGVASLPVPVCVGPEVHRRSTAAVRYGRDRLPAHEVTRSHGLFVTQALRTAFDTARWAASLTESVVALDALAHYGLINLADVQKYVSAHPGWSGVPQVRRALLLADGAVKSPWESRLRMVYVLESGLPRPLVNPSVFDERGNFVAMPDLLDVEAGLALEYDGNGHRDRAQHNRDNAREEALEDVGLVVVRADSYDYRYRRRRLIERMVAGRRRGMLRDRKQDRWALGSARNSEHLQVVGPDKPAFARYQGLSSHPG